MRASTVVLGLAQAWTAINQATGEPSKTSTSFTLEAFNSTRQTADTSLLAQMTNAESCKWDGTGSGYVCEWGDSFVDDNKQALTLVGDCKAAARVPRDTYVGDKRSNANDGFAEGNRVKPMIKVESTDLQGNTKSVDYIWKDFLTDPASSLDKVKFSDFGVYSLSMTASDYKGATTCVGCVAVVDKYPPQAIASCETSNFGTVDTPTDLTVASLAAANSKETAFYYFSSADNVKNNLANTLENDETRKFTDFLETTEEDLDEPTDYCFDSNIVKQLLNKDASKENPLTAGKPESELSALTCKRCCNKKTVLQEKYLDYKCGTTTFAELTGIGDSCSFKHCVSIASSTLVATTADVLSGVNTDATNAIGANNLYTAGSNTKIHRLSACSTIGSDACGRTETLSALVDAKAEWKSSIPGASISSEDYDVTDFVFWRYRINSGSWNSWSDDASYSFTSATTDVTLEAWTVCGKVSEFKFTYALYASPDLCSGFSAMLTKTDLSKTSNDGAICAYPKSDFAPVQFSYSEGTASLVCTIKVAAGTTVDFSTISGVAMKRSSSSLQVHEYFGIALTTDGVHKDTKKVQLNCDFTENSITQTCSTTFKVKECNEGANGDGTCSVSDCNVASSLGKYDACSGTIYQATESQGTQIKPDGQCCTSCNNNHDTLTCSAVGSSPNTADGIFKQCVKQTGSSSVLAVDFAKGSDGATLDIAIVMCVAGGGVLVGLIAFVVIRRRIGLRVNKEDAYHALLE